jgi:hypothetical protein
MTIIFYDYYCYELIKKIPLSLLDCCFWMATPRLVSRSISLFFPVFVSFSAYDNHFFIINLFSRSKKNFLHVYMETLPLLDHVIVGSTTLGYSTWRLQIVGQDVISSSLLVFIRSLVCFF